MVLDTIDLIVAVPGNAAPLVDQLRAGISTSADLGYRPPQPMLRLLHEGSPVPAPGSCPHRCGCLPQALDEAEAW
jgi:hypothetical protein